MADDAWGHDRHLQAQQRSLTDLSSMTLRRSHFISAFSLDFWSYKKINSHSPGPSLCRSLYVKCYELLWMGLFHSCTYKHQATI